MDTSRWGVHETHCCVIHGCKYGDEDCPVERVETKQEYPCEYCGEYPYENELVVRSKFGIVYDARKANQDGEGKVRVSVDVIDVILNHLLEEEDGLDEFDYGYPSADYFAARSRLVDVVARSKESGDSDVFLDTVDVLAVVF